MLSRSEYWLRILITMVVMLAHWFITYSYFPESLVMWGLYLVVAAGLSIVQLVWAVRRVNDVGLRWTWLLIAFIPVIGSIAFYILMLLPSDKFATYDDEQVDYY